MSGVCAVWLREHPNRSFDTLSAVSAGLSLEKSERVALAVDSNAGLGISARFSSQQIYEDKRVMVACDAELSNAKELSQYADNSGALQVNARTAGLIAALYLRFGGEFVNTLQGSFSIVIWDRFQKTVLAAVDRFGVKRLAYFNNGKSLVIASRLDALMRSGEIDPAINPRAVADSLNFTVVLGPETIFTNIHRIPPGTILTALDGKQPKLRTYWDMRYGIGRDANEAHLATELELLVQRSVAANSVADKPEELGAFLSGGTDSSTVVGLMSRMNDGAAKAFSIGFEEHTFNELEYADIAAKRFGARHYKYLLGPDDCFSALPDIVRYFDEPFGNASAIPTYFCALLASQNGVKTLLAGDGGDELFGGNERYRTEKIFDLYHQVPRTLRTALVEPFLEYLPTRGGLIGKARGYVRRANLPGVERLLSFQFLSTHSQQEVFAPDFIDLLNDYSVIEKPSEYYRAAPAREHLDRVLYMDLKITLGDSDLPKVTHMCEMAGVQARFPFLDTSVVEFSGNIPANLKVKGLEKRYLFKRAFRDLLPVEIIRKKKHGFGIPVASWLKSDRRFRELSHDVLLSKRARERGYFRQGFVEGLFEKHEADHSSYYGDTLWTLLVLEMWQELFDQTYAVARCR
jgi:asparagine synthase (glutamine-hydrolysing)